MYTSNRYSFNFNLLTKPVGPQCNLNCTYCYYLEKENMYRGNSLFNMSDETLETFTRKYIHEHPSNEVTFAWQGGEPTLLSVNYFKKALDLQKKYGRGKIIHNAFQTNGILLNDDWCRFFKKNNFLIGISLDGPEEIHNKYRLNRGGQGTFANVLKAIELLKQHEVEFNTLTVVNDFSVERPMEIYRFLKQIGSRYIQFIPIVERISVGSPSDGLKLVLPEYQNPANVAKWSVSPLKFGRFLVSVFDEWVKKDVGRIFIQIFDSTLANEVGLPAGICVFNKYCGNSLAIEHNGDVFACDHFVYPRYLVGNIHTTSLKKMITQPDQIKFGLAKHDGLPTQCIGCDVLNYCYGECPKNRFLESVDGERGLNYLCEGYRYFFRHVKPFMKFMANELAHERSPANVMHLK